MFQRKKLADYLQLHLSVLLLSSLSASPGPTPNIPSSVSSFLAISPRILPNGHLSLVTCFKTIYNFLISVAALNFLFIALAIYH